MTQFDVVAVPVPIKSTAAFNPIDFWAKVGVSPFAIENGALHFWWLWLALPFVVLACVAATPSGRGLPVLDIARDPYIITIEIALVLSAIAFKIWEKDIRNDIGHFVSAGVVRNDPDSLERFESHSKRLPSWLRSPWRYLLTSVFVLFAFAANFVAQYGMRLSNLPPLDLFTVLFYLVFLSWAYGIGVMGWFLLCMARWIAKMPREMNVTVQVGHPDGCGGLQPLGTRCFQSTIPLLVGMLLALLWTYARHVPIFAGYWGNPYMERLSHSCVFLILLLAVIAATLVFLPLRGLHQMMRDVRLSQERTYVDNLEGALVDINTALEGGEDVAIKSALDKTLLVQKLDPKSLLMSDWPFDVATVLKYGTTPLISIGGSILKGLFFASR